MTMKLNVYDTDRHVIEPLEMWRDYVDQKTCEKYPINMRHDTPQAKLERIAKVGAIGDVDLPPQYLIGQELIINNWSEALQIDCAHKNDESRQPRMDALFPATQLTSMEQSGIHRASLFPTFATFIVNHQHLPADASLAYAQGYNRWLYDYCLHGDNRLTGVAMISRHDPATMVVQLEAVLKRGWHNITLRPEPIAGRVLGHPDYNPFWQACEANNVNVALHGSTHLHGATAGTERFKSLFALHACSHPMEMQMAFLSLLESGVLERHPQLKFAFLEAGASWVPHWLWRLDNICYPGFPRLTADNIKMLPSEYFKRQCWVTIELEEPCLLQTIEVIGHKKLMFATDFPHPDHLEFELSSASKICGDLTDEQLADVLYDNAVDFYGE